MRRDDKFQLNCCIWEVSWCWGDSEWIRCCPSLSARDSLKRVYKQGLLYANNGKLPILLTCHLPILLRPAELCIFCPTWRLNKNVFVRCQIVFIWTESLHCPTKKYWFSLNQIIQCPTTKHWILLNKMVFLSTSLSQFTIKIDRPKCNVKGFSLFRCLKSCVSRRIFCFLKNPIGPMGRELM